MGGSRPLLVSSERGNNFDALRLALACLVIWSHTFALHLGSERTEWFSLALNGVYNAGNLAVMGFFVISGFLIAQSYLRSRSVLSYFSKRVRRIHPGYMVATTISGLAMIALMDYHGELRFVRATALNLLLRNASPTGVGLTAVNGALWSIPFEFWCYIGLALLGVSRILTRRWLVLAGMLAIMALHVTLDMLGKKPGLGIIGVIFGWPYLWTRMAPCFLLGIVVFNFCDSIPRSGWLLTGTVGLAFASSWVNQELGYLTVLPALGYTIFYIAYSPTIKLHNAAKFGDFSYGTYLYGFLIQKVLVQTPVQGWSTGAFFLTALALALAAGVLSWHLVEKWFARAATQARAGAEPVLARTW